MRNDLLKGNHFGWDSVVSNICVFYISYQIGPLQKIYFFVLLVEQAAQQWPVSSGADFNFASENKPKAGGFSARWDHTNSRW